MTKTFKPSSKMMQELMAELRENLNSEIIGFLLFLTGGFLLLALQVDDSIPWLVMMAGWTAPWIALLFIVLGTVLFLRERAGYWSAEALLGAEILLLGLQAGTFALNNSVATWEPVINGQQGGLIGWAVGSLFVAGLGQSMAIILTICITITGFAMLVRYTPLYYIIAYLQQRLFLGQLFSIDFANLLPKRIEPEHAEDEVKPSSISPTRQAANFVSPHAELDNLTQSVETEPVQTVTSSKRASSTRKKAKKVGTEKPKVSQKVTANAAKTKAAESKKPITGKRSTSKGSSSKSKRLRKPEALPSYEILADDVVPKGQVDVSFMAERIQETLSDFDVPVEIVHTESGPTVLQFGVKPLYVERAGQKRKIRVSRIANLADDLALALEAASVRIEAPVPGRAYVGIEVPNPNKTTVGLRGILESKEMRKSGGTLALGLGRDTSSTPILMDLARAPHMLIAGATGSGKSVCVNTIITSLLMQHGPESLRFIMVDPKMVELPGYDGIPHLFGKVVTDMEQVMGVLTWLLLQMDDRYRLFKAAGVRNLEAYNLWVQKQGRRKDAPKPLPYIVLVVDELADLMMTAADDIERQLCRLAQMARATGIHMILATQRPSTDVITGLIKANFPTRIAFSVTSQIDSRVILDTPGAERLLGRGDMLLMRPDVAKLFRVQGCWVADEEIEQIVAYWKAETADGERPRVAPWNGLMDRMDEEDELVLDATDLLRELKVDGTERCSTSFLQRRLRIGYPKASRLMEQLADRNIVGPDLGRGQGREILLKVEGENEEEAE